jgi:hypothetical protein
MSGELREQMLKHAVGQMQIVLAAAIDIQLNRDLRFVCRPVQLDESVL